MNFRTFGLGRIATAVGLVILLSACGHANQSVAPSALASDPSTYDGQDVTVSGTAKNPTTRQLRRGTATTYQLCDSSCINVVQFGATNVAEGSHVTVSGRFRTSFGRRMRMSNVLLVGGRMRPSGGASP